MVGSGQISNSSKLICMSSLPASMKRPDFSAEKKRMKKLKKMEKDSSSSCVS